MDKTMSKRDPYEVLEVSRDASEKEIKRAFRRIMRKHHPDLNPDDPEAEEKCKEAAEAFDILGNAEKRARFDRFGHEGVSMGAGAGFSSFSDIFSAFGDLFGGDIFGGSRGPRRGASYRVMLNLEFLEAARGCEKTISFKRQERCDPCSGSGAEPGTKPVTCGACQGQGFVVMSRGFFQIRQPCSACRGNGTVIKSPCKKCKGEGAIEREVEVEVKIPAGVDDGMQIRVSGEGDQGDPGAPPGDLIVVVRVEAHEYFRRINNDLVLELPIAFTQAALGSEIEIPLIDSKTKVKIDAGTQVGHEIRLRGKGFADPTGRYGAGDARIIVNIEVPKKISKRQEELLREYAELENENVSPKRKSFLEGLKNLFD